MTKTDQIKFIAECIGKWVIQDDARVLRSLDATTKVIVPLTPRIRKHVAIINSEAPVGQRYRAACWLDKWA